MKTTFGKLVCFFSVILSVTAVGLPNHVQALNASGAGHKNYTETVLALPVEATPQSNLVRLTARGETLDFYMQRDQARYYYTSSTGGKDWVKQDLTSLTNLSKSYLRSSDGVIQDCFVDEKGVFYAIVAAGVDDTKISETSFVGTPNYKLIKMESGVAQEIPNAVLHNLDMKYYYQLGGKSVGNELYVLQNAMEPKLYKSNLLIFDIATGKQKASVSLKALPFIPRVVANNRVYGTGFAEDGSSLLVACDSRTGQEALSLPIPKAAQEFSEMIDIGAAKDGSIYFTASSGLYRLPPDGTSLVKLVDGASTKLKADGRCASLACTDSGVLYAAIRDYLPRGETDASREIYKLYRYITK